MKLSELVNAIKGNQTIETIQNRLKCDRRRAIRAVMRLRKAGYVKTKRFNGNKRIYSISFENKLGGHSYIEVLNKNSPIKLAETTIHKVYGRELTIEETIIYAVKSRSPRLLLAALFLFRKPIDWNKLYALAKKERLERRIGALYDLARSCFRVRHMPDQFRTYAKKKGKSFEYVIDGLTSYDFKQIENYWHIYLPFNKKDIEEEA